ncbi:GrlR family regulatory protein [Bradyrhizobium sp. LHD-71]|uniref:GrlR family regulatory protein n=1 Tax=Bradyrhizobium sp. LHD-71 TaxID=3072141 RepID=UPI00280E0AB6|nr:GrlR family regulatory protein [Bradyrhizobium sp. LHD-71]MDQ8729160.1 GrlR family regulatory protein [Bradyrhizobium sp. LHD-71]
MRDGLYSIRIQMYDGGKGTASGIIVLRQGSLIGGDNYFYYTGTYVVVPQKRSWRGELVTHQHTEAAGLSLLFGGRDVGCGFTGVYADDGSANVQGTALVGRASVQFKAQLRLEFET